MKNLILLTFSFLFLTLIASCDKCRNVTCQNEGICDEGICDCPDGFEGDLCEIQTGSRILENHTIRTSCEDGTMLDESWTVTRSATTPTQFTINGIYRPGLSAVATITATTEFEISQQAVTDQGVIYTISGIGLIKEDGKLDVIDYLIETEGPANSLRCNAVAVD